MKSLIVIGASGVGKGTIIKHLLSRSSALSLVLSFTTRPIRPKEKHGIDYYFVTHEEFEKRKPEMLEHKQVFKNSYGTSHQHLQQLLKQGKIPILDIDIQGMMEIRKKIECEVLCVMPASWELLRQRLCGRKTESQQILNYRMDQNKKQVQKMLSLKGKQGIWFTTNYQFESTCYGIQKWMKQRFSQLNNLNN